MQMRFPEVTTHDVPVGLLRGEGQVDQIGERGLQDSAGDLLSVVRQRLVIGWVAIECVLSRQ